MLSSHFSFLRLREVKFPSQKRLVTLRYLSHASSSTKCFSRKGQMDCFSVLLVHSEEVGEERKQSQCILKQPEHLLWPCRWASTWAPSTGSCQEELPRGLWDCRICLQQKRWQHLPLLTYCFPSNAEGLSKLSLCDGLQADRWWEMYLCCKKSYSSQSHCRGSHTLTIFTGVTCPQNKTPVSSEDMSATHGHAQCQLNETSRCEQNRPVHITGKTRLELD